MNKNINIDNSKNVGYEINNSKSINMRFGFKNVLSIIFVALVIIMVVRLSLGKDIVTFYGFLDFLSNFNVNSDIVDFLRSISNGVASISLPDLTIDIFGVKIETLNYLAQLFNLIIKVNSILLWLASNVVYILSFLINFIQFVFVI